MHDDTRHVAKRVERILLERIVPAVYRETTPLQLEVWHVPGEPVPVSDALSATYEPFSAGTRWGRPWSTSWFRLRGTVPEAWAGQRVEAVIDLGFVGDWPGNQAEGLVHTAEGVPVKGVAPRNQYVPIARPAAGGERVDLLLEAAANPDILAGGMVPTPLGHPDTAGTDPIYTFTKADLAVLDEEVYALQLDVEVARELAEELAAGDPRRAELLFALERCVDALDLGDVSGTAAAARTVLAPALAKPATASAHVVSAAGHAHIDSAWLWPLRETMRKNSRTFSNVTALAEEYPDLVFACSSAQQYAWTQERYPVVFERIKKAIADGTWAPVGGQWVEADGNLPGGEALARQIVVGTKYFREQLGVEPHGVWLPDSFGYTAAYPQLARLAGFDWFLTQKISWNETNKFPHHSFWWEGIDGSRIFTHFPPADTYNGNFDGAELAHVVRNFQDKGRATTSLYPFGHGDGGGGPTREMVEKARRTADLEGSPRVVIEHPDAFFARAQAEYADAPVWSGELYLELHRGTYTSQAKTKRGNRRSEHLLREAELWATAAVLGSGAAYPEGELDALWKTVLLHQFHDILPGSSIAWVHRQAEETYGRVAAELSALVEGAASALSAGSGLSLLNTSPLPFRGVAVLPEGTPLVADGAAGAQRLADGRVAVAATVAAQAAAPVVADGRSGDAGVEVEQRDGLTLLDNGVLRVAVDGDGLLPSVVDVASGRELVAVGHRANLLQLHTDFPKYWDAWDVDAHYRRQVTDLVDADSVEVVDSGPLVASVKVVRTFGASRLEQLLVLRAGSDRLEVETDVDWHEREKMLKAAFPLDVHAERFSSEIQFGHVVRPTHTNTSWDAARFEVAAHRWVHVGEPGFGVVVANDSTYGHDVTRSAVGGGPGEPASTCTTVRLSLLRAPRVPDPEADQGTHRFTYAVAPAATPREALRHGYELNLPVRAVAGSVSVPSVATTTSGDALVESVRLADDGSGDVLLRVYEPTGARGASTLHLGFPAGAVRVADLHGTALAGERAAQLDVSAAGDVQLDLRPFQVLTLRVSRA
ncbi:alpha-mannosidase [Quadrisphaera setariae]|uniref:alpha-mannosidase n=1 Tax=Quadrisphaera setariae TaxID=2593304 RepID=A0A5C8Z5R8_9ACTN|nr:glycoside hydrolase family 38 C-terminal domain-containing protein [Quadrisphaera setariae]TXR52270.1 alpha-mannosidase [Quadrisphaera setariae]